MALGAEDKKSGAGEFDTLVAAPFLPADLTQLGKLLGVPNVTPKPAKGKAAVDIRKPLPEGTAEPSGRDALQDGQQVGVAREDARRWRSSSPIRR